MVVSSGPVDASVDGDGLSVAPGVAIAAALDAAPPEVHPATVENSRTSAGPRAARRSNRGSTLTCRMVAAAEDAPVLGVWQTSSTSMAARREWARGDRRVRGAMSTCGRQEPLERADLHFRPPRVDWQATRGGRRGPIAPLQGSFGPTRRPLDDKGSSKKRSRRIRATSAPARRLAGDGVRPNGQI
jgi:hypothetical protein